MDYGFFSLYAEAEYNGNMNPSRITVKSMYSSISALSMMEGVKEFLKRKGRKIENCTCESIYFHIELAMPNTFTSTDILELPDGSKIYTDSIWLYRDYSDKWIYRDKLGKYESDEIDEKAFMNRLAAMVETISRASNTIRIYQNMEYEKKHNA